MKIAIVGKGGSGKSSVSWLILQMLQAAENQVLAIDADHNMDLAYLLGMSIDDSFPTLHRAHDQFRIEVGQVEDRGWHNIVLDERTLPRFSLAPKDTFTTSVSKPVSDQADLMVVGLGAADVLFSSRCAHGHSAPLKYYLPLLDLQEKHYCIIDGVAGVDMMNFGLFTGADAVVVVVEPHPNSIRVYREVSRIADQCALPVFAMINKTRDSVTRTELVTELGDRLLGELPIDTGVMEYDLSQVGQDTKDAVTIALERLKNAVIPGAGLERLRAFETVKQTMKSTA